MYCLPWQLSSKEPTCQYRRCKFDHWVEKVPQRRKWQSTPVFLPAKSHQQRSLEGYSSQGCQESDMTQQLNNNCIYRKLLGNFSLERKVKSFSCVQLFVTLWIVACQAALSMGFSRREYLSELPCPPTGIFLSQGSNLCLLCLLHWQESATWEALISFTEHFNL